MTYRPSRRERLQVIFAFLVFFGGAMFLVSPDPTRAQTLFRIALVIIGIVGLAWLNVRGTGG
jgi:hypothetical protein